jgi:hypothetical protein
METLTKPLQKIMNDALFRHFVRINFPKTKLANWEIDCINEFFTKYLYSKFKDSNNLKKILPANELDVIIGMDSLARKNGYHPALVMHFCNFLKENQKE